MVRVKAGVVTRRRHKKILKSNKGYKGALSTRFRVAKQAWIRAGMYAYRDRRTKKRTNRSLWILRINAALRVLGMKYSEFINVLNVKQISLDRKILSNLAMSHKKAFNDLIAFIK